MNMNAATKDLIHAQVRLRDVRMRRLSTTRSAHGHAAQSRASATQHNGQVRQERSNSDRSD